MSFSYGVLLHMKSKVCFKHFLSMIEEPKIFDSGESETSASIHLKFGIYNLKYVLWNISLLRLQKEIHLRFLLVTIWRFMKLSQIVKIDIIMAMTMRMITIFKQPLRLFKNVVTYEHAPSLTRHCIKATVNGWCNKVFWTDNIAKLTKWKKGKTNKPHRGAQFTIKLSVT